jgi:Cu/Ag efflux protein CusF
MNRIVGLIFAAVVAGVPAAFASAHVGNMAEGEVRKVDKEQRKVTVKHGEIKNLEMPPMTMVFRVKDAALLDKVKEGDKIMFSAEKLEGNITITQIEAKK